MPRKYAGPLRPGERSAKVSKRYTKKLTRAAPIALSDTKKLIKSVILKTAETKYKSLSIPKAELFHNVPNSLGTNIMSVMPSQNDTDGGRTGDEIYTQGFKFRLMFGSKHDRPNVTYRCFVVKYQNDLSGWANDYNKFFHNITGNSLLDPVQYKRFKVLKTFKLRSKGTSMEVGEAGKEFVRTKEFWVPLRKKLKFTADAENKIANMPEDVNIIVCAYDAYGTLITDNIAYCQGACTLYYKDP